MIGKKCFFTKKTIVKVMIILLIILNFIYELGFFFQKKIYKKFERQFI